MAVCALWDLQLNAMQRYSLTRRLWIVTGCKLAAVFPPMLSIRTLQPVQRRSSGSLQGALQVMENAVAAASKKPEQAELLLSQDARNQLRKSEDDYRVFLAPFLHGPRSAIAKCLSIAHRH